MQIVKGDGTVEEFDIHKLEMSMERSGAPKATAEKVARNIAETITDGMTTSVIYTNAFKALKKEEKTMAARYSMRRAILELGPTGFPFEDFFCELMRSEGYNAKVRQVVQGRCTEHEVDVLLEKDGARIGAELKFHNTHGFKTDLRTALYVRARFWDIEFGAEDRNETCPVDEGWLVTNTKFTGNAVRYAECAGIKILGWDYPQGNSLADIIQRSGLYPLTVLTSISRKEEAALFAQGVTLCKHIVENPDVLTKAGIPKRKHQEVIDESSALCGRNVSAGA